MIRRRKRATRRKGERREASGWRDVLQIHPAAELLPRLSNDQLRELAADIKTHGLKNPVTLWRDGGRLCLLDGISRLDAMELAGIVLVDEQGELRAEYIEVLTEEIDPYAYVISANIRRRHLTATQKGKAIEKLLKATPEKSDRQIAEMVKASPTTVGKKRAKLEATGDLSTMDTRQDSKGRGQPARKPARHKNPAESRKQAARQVAKRVAAATVESEVNKVARLRARIQDLEAEVDQLKRENLDLQSEVDELRARLGLRRPRRRRND